jgi:hypothetical protein
MGWRLRLWRSRKIAPGVRVNMSRSGPSISIGPRGAKVTISRKGARRTVGLPGSGAYLTTFDRWDRGTRSADPLGSSSVHVALGGRCIFCGTDRDVSGPCPACGLA